MRTLIVEDDFTSRLLLQAALAAFGECHVAVNGIEAVAAFQTALAEERPYDLICMDVMMPEMDGRTALNRIREIESAAGTPWRGRVRIVMTTALDDIKDVSAAFSGLCDAYLTKPIDTDALRRQLSVLQLVA